MESKFIEVSEVRTTHSEIEANELLQKGWKLVYVYSAIPREGKHIEPTHHFVFGLPIKTK